MASKLEIVNRALTSISHSHRVAALDGSERTREADIAIAEWANELDKALASVGPLFAWRRAALALTNEEAGEFAYAFALPADYIAPVHIESELGRDALPRERAPFRVSHTGVDTRFLCDLEAPVLVYVARVDDPTQFPPHFADLLSWRLAERFALGLQADPQLAAYAAQRADRALFAATAEAARSQHRDPQPLPPRSRARRGV